MPRRQVSPTDTPLVRLLGSSPTMEALRGQLQQLVRFDTPGNPAATAQQPGYAIEKYVVPHAAALTPGGIAANVLAPN